MIINELSGWKVPLMPAAILLLFGFFSCRNKQETEGEKGRVMEMATGLPGGRAFEIDVPHSEIIWTLRKSDGAWLKGRFKPAKGFVLLEGNSLAAGYLEGDLWKNNEVTDSSGAPTAGAMKFLKDSLPQLFSTAGRRIRLDLKQISRVIPKSEFGISGISDSLAPTHDFHFMTEMADSSAFVRIPLRLQKQGKTVLLNGRFQLNLREFGILFRQQPAPGKSEWIPEAGLEFRIRFLENYPR